MNSGIFSLVVCVGELEFENARRGLAMHVATKVEGELGQDKTRERVFRQLQLRIAIRPTAVERWRDAGGPTPATDRLVFNTVRSEKTDFMLDADDEEQNFSSSCLELRGQFRCRGNRLEVRSMKCIVTELDREENNSMAAPGTCADDFAASAGSILRQRLSKVDCARHIDGDHGDGPAAACYKGSGGRNKPNQIRASPDETIKKSNLVLELKERLLQSAQKLRFTESQQRKFVPVDAVERATGKTRKMQCGESSESEQDFRCKNQKPVRAARLTRRMSGKGHPELEQMIQTVRSIVLGVRREGEDAISIDVGSKQGERKI
ncbi:hypothetical protein C8R45DRAFT_935075 [Mycena sanguinolenta]|nr:hypothetical protein C8R45DRAFT_935075 [Mycena sanguinolenta]